MGTYRIQVSSSSSFSMDTASVVRYSSGWKTTEFSERKTNVRVAKIQAQSYQEIKQQCLKEGVIWEDPDFPACDKSLYYSQIPGGQFQWKRPKDLCSEPRMLVDGASRFDVCQGDLGNCWFLASIASLCASGNQTGNQKILTRLVPEDNSFIKDYAGVFHFSIWQYGKWTEVCVDDQLPTINGRLVYLHSAQHNEFWTALLEKAYAKLNGSYEALAAGCAAEAMEDFTGGVAETFNFKKGIPNNLYDIMLKAFKRCSLMSCTIDATGNAIESILPNGLVIGHAYSITGVKQITVRGNKINLVRIRNPWGSQYEWKGSWGDQSAEWGMLTDEQRKELGITFDADGEFWMDYNDFTSNYHKLEICHLTPDNLSEMIAMATQGHTWKMSLMEGSWRRKVNAGGCRNFLQTFWTNPQYRVEVSDMEEGGENDAGSIIVALMQKERRKKKSEGLDYLTIGYSIYKLQDPNCGPLDLDFFKYNAAAARSPTFSNLREVCGRHRLPPGHYVIIPTTFKPDEEGDFMLRIYSEQPTTGGELDEETGLMPEEDEKEAPSLIVIGTKQIEHRRRRMRSITREVTETDVMEERQARVVFRKHAGEDMELDAYELRGILGSTFMADFHFNGFSLETCRSMVAMMDIDKSGKLGYDEFKTLWTELRQWKKIFNEFDVDKSGNLNSFELREALNSAGIKVSNSTFNGLVMRYSDQAAKIQFDDFTLCAIRIKTMFGVWKSMSEDSTAKFSLDQFIQTTMYS